MSFFLPPKSIEVSLACGHTIWVRFFHPPSLKFYCPECKRWVIVSAQTQRGRYGN